MHRDLLINPVRRRFSASASAKFVFLAEAIGRAYEPTQTQLNDLDRAYQSTGEYLAACAEFDGLLYRVHAYGSRQLGTMVRPMDPLRDGYDVDLAACLAREGLLRYGGPGGPARLIEHMYVALKRYADRHDLKLERDDRCVTMTYAGGMRADFLSIIDDPSNVVLYGDTHGRIPDRDLQRYLSTNPRGYCRAFDKIALIAPTFEGRAALNATFDSMRKAELLPLPDSDEVFARLLSRLVQLTKINRNIAFGAPRNGVSLAPSSSILTTLVANAYAIEAPKSHDGPMDLLLDIVQLMPKLIKRFPMPDGSEFWHLDNPTAQNDNLAACMDSLAKQKAFDAWQERLVMDLNALVDAIDQSAGMDVVARAVERAFGPRARTAVLEDNSQRREANRSSGRGIFVLGSGAGVMTAARSHTNYGD
ncbi:nucleotidyltransferase [Variovorax paradoxus]|nr:nucleotidyltransferase [Variovorax paradoxus]MBT2303409.1 nucleotidyltransferase [Variovorax paradoxus]